MKAVAFRAERRSEFFNPEPLGTRERVEIVHVFGRGHFQRQLGVFEREEPAGARQPVQPVAASAVT